MLPVKIINLELKLWDAGHAVPINVVLRNEKLLWHNSIQLGHVSLSNVIIDLKGNYLIHAN